MLTTVPHGHGLALAGHVTDYDLHAGRQGPVTSATHGALSLLIFFCTPWFTKVLFTNGVKALFVGSAV